MGDTLAFAVVVVIAVLAGMLLLEDSKEVKTDSGIVQSSK